MIRACLFGLEGVIIDVIPREIQDISPDFLRNGFFHFLKDLKIQEISIGVCSARTDALEILDRLRLTHFFDIVMVNNGLEISSPEVELFGKVRVAMEMEATEILLFTGTDAQAAAAASAGFTFYTVGKVEHLEAQKQIDNFENLRWADLFP